MSFRVGTTAREATLFMQITFATGSACANIRRGHTEFLHSHNLSGLPFPQPACSDLAGIQTVGQPRVQMHTLKPDCLEGSLTLPLASCAALGKSPDLPVPQLSGVNDSTHLWELLRGSNTWTRQVFHTMAGTRQA